MFKYAHRQIVMTWSDIWEKLTGEGPMVHVVTTGSSNRPTSIDFVELCNPGNCKAEKGVLVAGTTYDVKVDLRWT